MEKWRKMLDSMPDEEEPPPPADLEEAFAKACIVGSEMHEKGDLDGAMRNWREALNMDPSDASLWWRCGAVRSAMGDLEGAVEDLSEAVSRDPSHADAWFSRASARCDLGDQDGAVADFGECLRLEPRRVEAWCCRGTARLAAGDNRGAASDGTEALKVDATAAGAWGLRANARHRLGDHAGAIDDCRKALELDPDVEWVQVVLERAQAAITGATGPGGDDECWRRMLGQYRAGSDDEGNGAEATAPGGAGDCGAAAPECAPPVHREEGNSRFKQGDLQGAIEAYRRAVEAGERDWVLAVSNQAICHLRLREFPEAVEAADRCLSQAGAPPKAYLTKFKALAAQREWLAAFATLRELRARPGVGENVEAACDQEERSKRQERFDLCVAREADNSSDPVAINAGDAEQQDKAEALGAAAGVALVSHSLARTVEFALSVLASTEVAARVDIVGAHGDAAFAFGHLPQLSEAATIHMVGPNVQCAHLTEEEKTVAGKDIRVVFLQGLYHEAVRAEDAPDVAVLCCPVLGSDFEGWAPTIKHLISMGVLTVVTGSNVDQSLVQNEDILRALGCDVVLPTTRSPHGCWMFRMCKNYHVMAFRGGAPRGLALVPALKQRLEKRGFHLSPS